MKKPAKLSFHRSLPLAFQALVLSAGLIGLVAIAHPAQAQERPTQAQEPQGVEEVSAQGDEASGDESFFETAPAPDANAEANADAAPRPNVLEAGTPGDEAPPIEASWGRGILFRSDDDLFTMQIRGRVQLLALTEEQAGRDANISFQVRRARLVFMGNLLSHQLQYYVQFGFAPRDMEPDILIPLRDAVLTWNAHRDVAIRAGQMKVPFNRERVISSSALQMVDRSIVNAELTLDRDIGVQVFSNDLFGLGGRLAYQIGVFSGNGRLRLNEGPGLLYVARLQVQPFGAFDDGYTEADLTRENRARLSIGFGAAYNHLAQRTRSTTGNFYALDGFDYAHGEVDVHFKHSGFSLLAEGIVRAAVGTSERTGLVDGVSQVERAQDGIGWLAQAGLLIPETSFEVVLRFAMLRPLGNSALLTNHEALLGLNWYALGHDLKFQMDGGLLVPEAIENRQLLIRLQTQAFF